MCGLRLGFLPQQMNWLRKTSQNPCEDTETKERGLRKWH